MRWTGERGTGPSMQEHQFVKLACGEISEILEKLPMVEMRKAAVSNLVAFYGTLDQLSEFEQRVMPRRRTRRKVRTWKVF